MSIGNSVYSMILEWQRSEDFLPQSKLFRIEIKVKMYDGHLHTLGIIHYYFPDISAA